eukprot:gene5835-6076_t
MACSADNQFGAPTRQYGLSPSPCRLCPMNMKTTAAPASSKTAGGLAISSDACVTQAGYGYSNRVSEQCPKGTFNAGGNQAACQDCAYGMTTAGSGSTSSSMCIPAAGFAENGTECPVGELRLT